MSHTCHMPHPSHSSWFGHPNNIHVPNLKSHFHYLCCTKGSVQVRGLTKCLVTSCLRLGVFGTSPNSRLGRPLLVSHPILLFSMWASTVHICRPVRPSATWGRAMLWWQGPTYSWKYIGIVLSLHSKIVWQQGLLLRGLRSMKGNSFFWPSCL
jgi:hypothetical protein